MSSPTFESYRHSGKFAPHGPLLALVAAALMGFPLGFAYAYIVRWVPFIYVNFFATIGYGCVFGFAGCFLMKFGKVRSTLIAVLSALGMGFIALYFGWNGHLHAVFEGVPLLCGPEGILAGMRQLYEQGSWGLRSGGAVTGIPLAIVWVVEASIIVGIPVFMTRSLIAGTPFCERAQCWLDEEKKINTLEPFTDPAQVAALKAGDLGPLSQAKPKTPDAMAFARLTLKHSPKCDTFCTVRIQNVTLKTDKDGNLKETVQELTRDLILPRTMFDLIAKFEGFGTTAPALPAS